MIIDKKYIEENFKGRFTINSDGIYDIDCDVMINCKNITKFDIKFNIVNGGFYCSYNQLKSLEGGPNSVKGDFYCSNNQLTSLEGAPKSVNGNFNCSHNNLNTLEFSPIVENSFNCYFNQLKTLKTNNILKFKVMVLYHNFKLPFAHLTHNEYLNYIYKEKYITDSEFLLEKI